jgi:O-antigen ligase
MGAGLACAFLFSLALLGETYLQYLLWGVGAIIMLPLLLQSEPRSQTDSTVWVLWAGFLLSVIASTFHSINMPLSLAGLTFYIFALLIFSSVVALPKTISAELIIGVILVTSICITVESALLNIRTDWAVGLPGMNLLYSSYGHNHLSSVVVIALPLSWWAAVRLSSKKNAHWPKKMLVLLPILFTIALVSSFSRMAIGVGLLQMIVVYLLLKKKNASNLINTVVSILLGLLMLVVIIKTGLGVYQMVVPDFVCPIVQLNNQLCKSPLDEQRLRYWIQAGRSWVDHPLLGSGPHTFGIATKKYNQTPISGSNFAHNSLLQAFSELGFLGGLFYCGLIGYLLYGSWKLSREDFRHKKFSWPVAVFISVVSIVVISLFDFDFSFTAIFSFSMILLGLVWRELPHAASSAFTQNIKKWSKTGLAAFVISMAVLFVVVECLIRTQRYQQAFRTFPFFHWHRKIFEYTVTEQKEKDFLQQLYQNHPDFFQSASMSTSDKVSQTMARQRLFELDPWSRLNMSTIPYYLHTNQWSQVDYELRATHVLWQSQRKDNQNTVFTKIHEDQLVDWLMAAANAAIDREESNEAAQYILIAQSIDEWAIDRHEPASKILDRDLHVPLSFFSTLARVDSSYFGRYRQAYGEAYLVALKGAIVEDRTVDVSFHAKSLRTLMGDSGGYMWNELSAQYERLTSAGIMQNNQRYIAYIDQWYTLWEQLQTNQLEYSHKEKLSKSLMEIADFYTPTDLHKANEYAQRARLVLNH